MPHETPHHGHPPITMRRHPDGAWRTFSQVGDYCYDTWSDDDPSPVLWIATPCSYVSGWGDGTKPNWNPVRWRVGDQGKRRVWWEWNANPDCPTLYPSLHAVGDWHGWVKDGVLYEHGTQPRKPSSWLRNL